MPNLVESERDLIELFAILLWGPTGFQCADCGHTQACRILTRPRARQCSQCRRWYSVTSGTLLQHTRLPLLIWKRLFEVLAAAAPRVPTCSELAGELGVARSTAWLLLQKVLR